MVRDRGRNLHAGRGGEHVRGDGVEGPQEAVREAVGGQQAAQVVERGRAVQLQHMPHAPDARLCEVPALPDPVLHQAHQHRDALHATPSPAQLLFPVR